MNSNGTNAVQLTSAANTSVRPSWSRDGGKIAFTTNRDGLLNFEIYVMNTDGSERTRLTMIPAADNSPAW
jgi:TolB protein